MRAYKYLRIIACMFLMLLFTNTTASGQSKKMIWGIDGHPLAQEAYLGNWNLQSNLIKDLGLKYYRIDLATDKDGTINNDQFLSMVKYFKSNHIELLPVLMLNYNDSMDNAQAAYQAGYGQGSGFSRQYGANFKYYEIGNEQDNGLILSANFDGRSLNHYNLKKGTLVAAYINGMIKGLKKYDPTALVIVNCAFVHFGFFDILKIHKVQFDILGVHWYSNMGNLYGKSGYGNLLDSLYLRNKKPIWITEFNWHDGTKDGHGNNKAHDWITNNIKYISLNPHVKGFFMYELFDEPAFEKNNPNEAFYGLVSWTEKYKTAANKEIYYVYKKAIMP